MKKLMEILMELDDSIDWENETALIMKEFWTRLV